MPIKNHFPVFHKLRSGAYSYVWTDKCEQLLPKHYKERCLDYMMREPEPVHWKPDTRKYCFDKHGTLKPVQNHPIRVKYPVQCNYGFWAGEGVVQCWTRKIKSKKYKDLMVDRIAKFYVPCITERQLYSEILDKWFNIPCTNRAMDEIDDLFGLDFYILQTHERDLNSKLAMDLRRKMLLQLCGEAKTYENLPEGRQKVFKRYEKFMVPIEEAEWVGLSIEEALEKAETKDPPKPLKYLIGEQYLKTLKEYTERVNNDIREDDGEETKSEPPSTGKPAKSSSWFSFFSRGKSGEEKRH